MLKVKKIIILSMVIVLLILIILTLYLLYNKETFVPTSPYVPLPPAQEQLINSNVQTRLPYIIQTIPSITLIPTIPSNILPNIHNLSKEVNNNIKILGSML